MAEFGTLNQVSQAIGRLQEAVESLKQEHKTVANFRNLMLASLDELKHLTMENAASLKRMEPIVKDYEAKRNKVLGFILALSMLSGVVGYAFSMLKDYFLWLQWRH